MFLFPYGDFIRNDIYRSYIRRERMYIYIFRVNRNYPNHFENIGKSPFSTPFPSAFTPGILHIFRPTQVVGFQLIKLTQIHRIVTLTSSGRGREVRALDY